MIPSPIPAPRAVRWAVASCSSATHCSQQWKSTRSASRTALRLDLAASAGRRARPATPSPAAPCSSASAHQVAKSTSPGPCWRRKSSYARCRAGERGSRWIDLQRRGLGRPGRVAVDPVAGVGQVRVVGVPLQQLALGRGHVGDLADVLDPDVDRVGEPAGRRQVRRGLHRRHRRGRVQRVDEHEVGPELAAAPAGQLGQVGQVADPPRLAASAPSTAGS